MRLRSQNSLEELAYAILSAVQFEDDHLYEFRLRTNRGRKCTIGHPSIDYADYVAEDFAIGYLPLDVGHSMTFHFDFGDDWFFDVKLLSVDPTQDEETEPRVVASHGESPPQYDFDDDEYEDDEYGYEDEEEDEVENDEDVSNDE